MSPRAAWRLETLGFAEVHDYVGGKNDWLSFGLPRDGWAVLAADAVGDVPTCAYRDEAVDVLGRMGDEDVCVAVDGPRIVLGVVERAALERRPKARIEEQMTWAPTTVRPSEPLDELVHNMSDAGVEDALVTSSDGRLMGRLVRADAERLLDVGAERARPGQRLGRERRRVRE